MTSRTSKPYLPTLQTKALTTTTRSIFYKTLLLYVFIVQAFHIKDVIF